MRLSGATAVATISQIAKSKLGAVILGPAGMGTFNQLKNVWSLIHVLSNAGFYDGIVRRVARLNSESKLGQIQLQVATTSIFLGIFSCLFAAGSCLAAPWISSIVFGGDTQFAAHIAVVSISVPFAVFARIYKAILAGMQDVPRIVRTQISADLSSLAVFAVFVCLGKLWGAVLAFSVYQMLKAAFGFIYVRRAIGSKVLYPSVQNFCTAELKHNLQFGVNTFLLTPMSLLTTLVVARWIIGVGGVEANGVFAAAWMVSSVYIRTIHETASSYYLPVLSASNDDESLFANISAAIRLYSLMLTPCILGLVTFGPLLISLLFSREFSGAGRLLLFLLPGDLLRISSESIGVSYLARRHLRVYTGSYVVWVGLYLGLASYFVTDCGGEGVAIAYLCGHVIYAAFHVCVARLLLGYMPDLVTRMAVLGCFLVCLTASTIVIVDGSLIVRSSTLLGGGLLWWVVASRDAELLNLLVSLRRRLLSR